MDTQRWSLFLWSFLLSYKQLCFSVSYCSQIHFKFTVVVLVVFRIDLIFMLLNYLKSQHYKMLLCGVLLLKIQQGARIIWFFFFMFCYVYFIESYNIPSEDGEGQVLLFSFRGRVKLSQVQKKKYMTQSSVQDKIHESSIFQRMTHSKIFQKYPRDIFV